MDPAAADAPPRRLAVAWAATLATLLAATWRLWTPLRDTPRIAPTGWLGFDPGGGEFVLLGALASGLVRVAVWRSPRRGSVWATAALAALMALDQLRWQPWAYHALVAGVTLAACDRAAALAGLRAVAIAVYAYSAVAKLDAEFVATLGSGVAETLGAPASLRPAVALGLPLAELAVAGLLAASLRWRGLAAPACVAAAAMHAATIAVLSPWGLDHSLGVLIWNAGFAWQTVELFRPARSPADATPSRRGRLGRLACGFAVLAPLGTPVGWWDQWPGWALYAPGGERATLYVHAVAVDRLPEPLRRCIDEATDGPWRRVRLDDWVLADTGAPLYPQNRVVAAIALGLADRFALSGRLLVVAESPANRVTRERATHELTTREALTDAARLGRFEPAVVWRDRRRAERVRGP